MDSNTEKQMATKTCSDVTNLSPVLSFLDHGLGCCGLSAKDALLVSGSTSLNVQRSTTGLDLP
jgi:hypothetical protein